MSNFLPTELEKNSIGKLKKDIHLAMLMKHFNQQRPSADHLPLITSMVHCLKKQSVESECSNVVYFDVLSEKADNKATLLRMVSRIHHTFITELKQKWVLAVGDAKTYDILQDL